VVSRASGGSSSSRDERPRASSGSEVQVSIK
jgi:hypothetical protein